MITKQRSDDGYMMKRRGSLLLSALEPRDWRTEQIAEYRARGSERDIQKEKQSSLSSLKDLMKGMLKMKDKPAPYHEPRRLVISIEMMG